MGEEEGAATVKKSVISIAMILMTTLALVIGLPFLGVNLLNNNEAKNKENAMEVRAALMGKNFIGSSREYSTRSGGSINLMEFTEVKIECEFGWDDTVRITRTESKCEGTAVVIDGKTAYKDTYTQKAEYGFGEITASGSGSYIIMLGDDKCTIAVDKERSPIAIAIDGIKCERVN